MKIYLQEKLIYILAVIIKLEQSSLSTLKKTHNQMIVSFLFFREILRIFKYNNEQKVLNWGLEKEKIQIL